MDSNFIGHCLALIRSVARYFCISNDNRARDARGELRAESGGTDSFFVSLLQDLNELCDYWTSIDNVPSLEGMLNLLLAGRVYEDTADLLNVLESILTSSNIEWSDESPFPKLSRLHRVTDTWNLSQLDKARLDSLCDAFNLPSLPTPKRRALIRATEYATRSIRSTILVDDDNEVLSSNDEWAQASANRVCGPLTKLHRSILAQWACSCSDGHTDILASFALPCHEHGRGTACVLTFTSEALYRNPWRIISVLIENDIAEATSATLQIGDNRQHVIQPDITLHEILAQLQQQCYLDGKLSYNEATSMWSLTEKQPLQQNVPRPVMVSLQEWITNEQPCPISKVKFVDRIALAITICYAFLELGGSVWMPYKRIELNVWLSMRSSNIPNLAQTFLAAKLEEFAEDDSDTDEFSFEESANSLMPCLPALGKLILELVIGRAIAWKDVKKVMLEVKEQFPERTVCLEAVRSCIGFNDLTFKRNRINEEERLRTEFSTRVIHKLNYILTDGCRTSLESIIAQYTNAQVSQSRARRLSPAAPLQRRRTPTEFCLHDDGGSEVVSSEKYRSTVPHCLLSVLTLLRAERAKDYLKRMDVVNTFIEECGPPNIPVKVAIIDTGLRLGSNVELLYGSRIRECRSWLGTDAADGIIVDQQHDIDGHGTCSALAFLKTAALSDLYIAQVFGETFYTSADSHKSIANAIKHAVKVWKVDIISMSFGFASEIPEIHNALRTADDRGVLLFAAASNVGGNFMRARRWPAMRDNVICMYACEGEGNWYDRNPTAMANEARFAALGVSVPLWSLPNASGQSLVVHRSGTSISTPVGAAIAASVIETMKRMEESYVAIKMMHLQQHHAVKQRLSESEAAERREKIETEIRERYKIALAKLKTARGMRSVFTLMAERRTGYDYIQPWNLLRQHDVPITLVVKICEALENAHLLGRLDV